MSLPIAPAPIRKLNVFLRIKRGLSLFWDRGIANSLKWRSVALGIAIALLIILVELPGEFLLDLLLPGLGVLATLPLDGAELVILPFLIAALQLDKMVKVSPASRR